MMFFFVIFVSVDLRKQLTSLVFHILITCLILLSTCIYSLYLNDFYYHH